MKYLSLFSGIGGFELGIEQSYVDVSIPPRGKQRRMDLEKSSSTINNKSMVTQQSRTCVGYSEIDKYAVEIYEKHFNHKNYGDITKIDAKTLPDFDLIVGGFPCQSFSIAGKRAGFADTRGTLFFEIARILREKQPRLLLLENVKGLISHGQGRTFYTIITTLDELGYDLQWQVLNSKNFGVPQNRERVFIVGHLRGIRRPEVFPFGETNSKSIEKIVNRSQCNSIFKDSGISPTVSSGTHGYSNGCVQQLNKPTHSNDRIYGQDGISPTLNTAQRGNRQPFIMKTQYGKHQQDAYHNTRGIMSTLAPATHGAGSHLTKIKVPSAIRRLTPTECERLQGFPDGWTEGVSDTQRYKTLGNAVTVNVIAEIMKKLL